VFGYYAFVMLIFHINIDRTMFSPEILDVISKS